jgi:hypothetical protein
MRPPPGITANLNLILGLAGVVLAVIGVWSFVEQRRHRAPLEISCSEYSRTRPSARWLRALDCDVDYLNAGYRESRGTILELFFAVRPTGVQRTEPAVLVMATRDPAVLAIAQGGIGEGRQPDQEQFLIMMLRIVTTLNAARRIEGRVRLGWMDRVRSRRVLSGLTTPVAPGAFVVDLHASPSYTGPLAQIAFGAALLVGAIVMFGKVRQMAKPDPPVEHQPIEGEPIRLRGLLLVNLAPGTGVADIEYAPPLGIRAEVIAQITDAIEGMQFDARGRGTLRVPEVTAIVDVGRCEIVSSAIAGADGARGAAAIRQLLAATGWRAYMPAKGHFYE